jgi:hypothetical protein
VKPGKEPHWAAELMTFFSEITSHCDFMINVHTYYKYAETHLCMWISSRDVAGGHVVAFGTFNHIYMHVILMVQQKTVNKLFSRTNALVRGSNSSRSSTIPLLHPSHPGGGFYSSGQGSSSWFYNPTSVRCMVCSGDEHTSNGHKGSNSKANLTQKGNSWFWSGDKITLCWSFNGPNDCSRAASCSYCYKCSLCGSESRSVQLQSDNIFPIVTSFKHEVWLKELCNADASARFLEVPKGLHYGFTVGLQDFTLAFTFSPLNYTSSTLYEDLLIKKYSKEIELGCISQGYDPHILESIIGPYCMAPLGVIDSARRLHVIVNHSFSDRNSPVDILTLPLSTDGKHILEVSTTSINSVTDLAEFTCDWGSFSECWLLVADALEGTQATVFNVESAF